MFLKAEQTIPTAARSSDLLVYGYLLSCRSPRADDYATLLPWNMFTKLC
jgi:hypothetical protein